MEPIWATHTHTDVCAEVDREPAHELDTGGTENEYKRERER